MKSRGSHATKAEPGERPTSRPSFDPEVFARVSDSNLRTAAEVGSPSVRPTAPPPPAVPRSGPIDPKWVPLLEVARDDAEWFDITATARRVLAQVDGEKTVGALGDALGAEGVDVEAALADLAREGVIRWR